MVASFLAAVYELCFFYASVYSLRPESWSSGALRSWNSNLGLCLSLEQTR